jgi:hypothetical protein
MPMLAAHEHGSRGGKSFDALRAAVRKNRPGAEKADAGDHGLDDAIGSERMRSDSPTPPNRQTRVSPQPDQHGGAGHLHMGAQAVRLVGCSGSKPMTPPSGIATAISPTIKSSTTHNRSAVA